MSDQTAPQSAETGGPSTRDRFNRLADKITLALGSFTALAASVIVVVVWALTGPIFNFSDTWQLFINTTTTVVTFWMVFVIQNSANRDSKAVHLKLDEIIRSIEGASNAYMTLENASEQVVAEKAAEHAEVSAEHAEVSAEHAEVSAEHAEVSAEHAEVSAEHAEVSAEHAEPEVAEPNGDTTPEPPDQRGRSSVE